MNGYYKRVIESGLSYIPDIRDILTNEYLPERVLKYIKNNFSLNSDYPVNGNSVYHESGELVMLSLTVPNNKVVLYMDGILKINSSHIQIFEAEEFNVHTKEILKVKNKQLMSFKGVYNILPNPEAYLLESGKIYFQGKIYERSEFECQ